MIKTYRVSYTHTARDDLIAVGERIREVAGAETAEHYVERIIETAERLRERPKRQRIRANLGAGIRAARYRKYLMFYRVEGETVTIVRVLHGAREITQKLLQG
jgi:toxin ParE1/3/4